MLTLVVRWGSEKSSPITVTHYTSARENASFFVSRKRQNLLISLESKQSIQFLVVNLDRLFHVIVAGALRVLVRVL